VLDAAHRMKEKVTATAETAMTEMTVRKACSSRLIE
jgi:hypothetical protein